MPETPAAHKSRMRLSVVAAVSLLLLGDVPTLGPFATADPSAPSVTTLHLATLATLATPEIPSTHSEQSTATQVVSSPPKVYAQPATATEPTEQLATEAATAAMVEQKNGKLPGVTHATVTKMVEVAIVIYAIAIALLVLRDWLRSASIVCCYKSKVTPHASRVPPTSTKGSLFLSLFKSQGEVSESGQKPPQEKPPQENPPQEKSARVDTVLETIDLNEVAVGNGGDGDGSDRGLSELCEILEHDGANSEEEYHNTNETWSRTHKHQRRRGHSSVSPLSPAITDQSADNGWPAKLSLAAAYLPVKSQKQVAPTTTDNDGDDDEDEDGDKSDLVAQTDDGGDEVEDRWIRETLITNRNAQAYTQIQQVENSTSGDLVSRVLVSSLGSHAVLVYLIQLASVTALALNLPLVETKDLWVWVLPWAWLNFRCILNVTNWSSQVLGRSLLVVLVCGQAGHLHWSLSNLAVPLQTQRQFTLALILYFLYALVTGASLVLRDSSWVNLVLVHYVPAFLFFFVAMKPESAMGATHLAFTSIAVASLYTRPHFLAVANVFGMWVVTIACASVDDEVEGVQTFFNLAHFSLVLVAWTIQAPSFVSGILKN